MAHRHVLRMLDATANMFLNDASVRSEPRLWTASDVISDRRKPKPVELVRARAQAPRPQQSPKGELP